ncbi:MAG: type II toxin-antitoxin system RelE/ParE family toxin [Patescibacteria group bacterium]
MYNIIVSAQAKKELKRISKSYKEPFIIALQEIKENPLIGKPLTRELTGKFSYKVGAYRIIYKIKEKDKIIQVITAGHRARVYVR